MVEAEEPTALEQPLAQRPWFRKGVVAEVLDNVREEPDGGLPPIELPAEVRPLVRSDALGRVSLEETEFEATLAKVLAEGLGVSLVQLGT